MCRINLNHNALVAFSLPNNVAKRVKRLSLEHNSLDGASFSNMHSLVRRWSTFLFLIVSQSFFQLVLSLAHNRLDAVPLMSHCKKLVNLNLSHNRIAGEFERLAPLAVLEHLDLSYNELDLNRQQLLSFILSHLPSTLKSLDLVCHKLPP